MGSKALDLIFGLSFVYLLLATAVSAFNETLAWVTSRRAKTLLAGIKTLLDDPTFTGLAKNLYDHPLIRSTTQGAKPPGGQPEPSYIDSLHFAKALIDTIQKNAAPADAAAPLASAIAQLPNEQVKQALQALLNKGVASAQETEDMVAAWFDASMNRLSGAYKRHTQLVITLAAVALCAAFNVDTVRITRTLWTDPAVRQAMAERTTAQFKPLANADLSADLKSIKDTTDAIEGLAVPVGWTAAEWTATPPTAANVATKVLGILISILAVMLGAPFWFDALSRIANLRAAGPPGGGRR